MNDKLIELFCPQCQHTLNVLGERTEIFRQYVAYCKQCRCEFTVNYFRAVKYTDLNYMQKGALQNE